MKSLLLAGLFLLTAQVFGAECTLITTRYACPGQEVESYSKCQGKQSCENVVVVANAEECTAKALEACKNSRKEITKYKSVLTRVDGQDLDQKDFCDKDSGAYTVAANFPYRNSAACK